VVTEAVDLLDSGEARVQVEVELRAVSLVAAGRVLAAVRSLSGDVPVGLRSMNIMDLDWYLWVVGKRPEIRSVERHVCKQTCYY